MTQVEALVPVQQTWRCPHWVSAVHAAQWCFTHACWKQSATVQQSPATQAPSQQRSPAPQSQLSTQARQRLASHSSPFGQSAELQQVPCLHRPRQQTEPAAHWPELVHAWQLASTQICGAQSAPQQSPATQ
jgi:hypothetical protein